LPGSEQSGSPQFGSLTGGGQFDGGHDNGFARPQLCLQAARPLARNTTAILDVGFVTVTATKQLSITTKPDNKIKLNLLSVDGNFHETH